MFYLVVTQPRSGDPEYQIFVELSEAKAAYEAFECKSDGDKKALHQGELNKFTREISSEES